MNFFSTVSQQLIALTLLATSVSVKAVDWEVPFRYYEKIATAEQSQPNNPLSPPKFDSQFITVKDGIQAYLIDRRALYIPGQTYAKLNPELLAHENGKWLEVPFDYRKKDGKKLKLYYASALPFDPSKPTVIYVTGGPGQVIHQLFDEYVDLAKKSNVNIVLFDPRGIGFSSPDKPEDYFGYELWGSENIARDIKAIADDLKVDKVSVYGISYGTVPATIFASMFPERTRSVLLEGVLGGDMPAFQMSSSYAELLNRRVLPHLKDNGKVFLAYTYNAFQEELSNATYSMGMYAADALGIYAQWRADSLTVSGKKLESLDPEFEVSSFAKFTEVFGSAIFQYINKQNIGEKRLKSY